MTDPQKAGFRPRLARGRGEGGGILNEEKFDEHSSSIRRLNKNKNRIEDNIYTPHTGEGACVYARDESGFEKRFNAFCEQWGISVDCYSPLVAELDFEKLNLAYMESATFLQVMPCAKTLSWLVKNVASIYGGKYKDKLKRAGGKREAREQGTEILKNMLFNEMAKTEEGDSGSS